MGKESTYLQGQPNCTHKCRHLVQSGLGFGPTNTKMRGPNVALPHFQCRKHFRLSDQNQ